MHCSKPSTRRLNITARNEKGETGLHAATIKNDLAKVQAFIQAGASVNVFDNCGWCDAYCLFDCCD